MRVAKLLALAALLFSIALRDRANAQSAIPSCSPKILDNRVVATAAQRQAAGQLAQPPLTDQVDGFAWPDTPLGAARIDGHYLFFGSDGGLHLRQIWHGHPYGNNKYGSIARTVGTLDNPLGTAPPVNVTIRRNPDSNVNPFYGKL